MASSVQFRDIDGVIKAYENRDVPAWSLWQQKQFMFKYEGTSLDEGAQQLEDTLKLLGQSSNAIYTLKVYEDLPGGKIKSNTPDDGSFNFKINGEEQQITQGQYASLKYNNDLRQELAEIKEKLAAIEEEGEEEPEPENKLGVIGDIISHPVLQPIIQSFMASLLTTKSALPAAPPQMQRVAISGINDDVVLNEAVNQLKECDPKLPEHLAKLAKMAKENPQGFNFLIATLDQMEL